MFMQMHDVPVSEMLTNIVPVRENMVTIVPVHEIFKAYYYNFMYEAYCTLGWCTIE